MGNHEDKFCRDKAHMISEFGLIQNKNYNLCWQKLYNRTFELLFIHILKEG